MNNNDKQIKSSEILIHLKQDGNNATCEIFGIKKDLVVLLAAVMKANPQFASLVQEASFLLLTKELATTMPVISNKKETYGKN